MASKLQTPVDLSPEFARALGRVLANTAVMEMHLLMLAPQLLGTTQRKARLILDVTNSLAAKIDLLIVCAEQGELPVANKNNLISTLKRAKKASSERNKYVHATWGAGTAGQLQRLCYSNAKGMVTTLLTAADIDAFADSLADIAGELIPSLRSSNHERGG